MPPRRDVGFVPVECPGWDGTGAAHTSALLVERLSRHHDLTVYVASQHEADRASLPATDRVEYVLRDGLSMLPHPLWNKLAALEAMTDELNRHDLVHSYSSAFVPVLSTLETNTLVTLNSYLPVCPKADFRYRGREKCTGPGRAKCPGCVAATSWRRRQGPVAELKASYLALGQVPFVERVLDARDGVTAYHALSPHLRDDYRDLGFPADDITVVPHFFEERFLADGSDDVGAPEPPIDLLYVGALQDIKGVDTLVRALPTVRDRGHDVRLRVAGSGPLASGLRDLADDLGIADRITWLGRVDHDRLPAEYDAADVFVYPGVIDEPFGRVMLEALAAHTPILSSDVGSMDAIVGPAGELFEPGNERSLADGLDSVLSDYERYRSAVPDQLDRFSPSTVIEAYLTLYDAVVTGDHIEASPTGF